MRTKEVKARNKGVTLIALVVTIIVLLILAGVSISMLSGDDGIIINAQKSNEENAIGREKEIVTLAVGSALSTDEGYEIKRDNLNIALANHIGTEGVDYTLSETAPFIVTYSDSGRSYIIDEKGKVSEYVDISKYVEVGQYVNYNPTVLDKSGTPVEVEKLNYTSPKGDGQNHGNGNSPQTFTVKTGTKWRILSIENGTVELILKDVIKTDAGGNFILNGPVGYLYAEQELNEVCKIYGYGYGANTSQITEYSYGGPLDGELKGQITGSGARSITVEDINKYAGVKEDENGILKFSDGTIVDSNYGNTTNPTIEIKYPTITTQNASPSGGVKNLKYTNYSYAKNKIENSKIKEMIFNGNSWLASRCIDPNSNNSNFNVRGVYGGNLLSSNLCNGSWHLREYAYNIYAVRPIVTLKSEVIDLDTGYNEANGGWQLK